MKAHGDIAGDINPQRYFMFLGWGGIAGRQFVQDLLAGDGPEEVRLGQLAGRIDIIEVAIAECLADQPIIALKKHHRGLLFGAVLHQGFSRRNFSIWSSNLRICLKTSLTRARARRYCRYCSLPDRNRSNFSGGIVIRRVLP